MTATTMIFDLLPSVSDVADTLLSVQEQPYDPYWDDAAPDPYAGGGATIGFGALIGLMFLLLALNCLLGWWGKSRAEDCGVNPWVGFALGFFMGFIGVALVPVFRTDRMIVTRNPRPLPQQPMPTNPMYAPDTHAYPPPQGYGQPVQEPYAPPPQPQPHAHSMQPGFAPPPPQPTEPEQMLVADEYGYVECPHCQSRTKSGRKACMTCGNFLPPVYDPSVK